MSVAIIGAVVGVAGVAYSAYSQHKAAKKAAQVDEQTASYNAELDREQARQLQLDTEANIRLMERRAEDYISRQEVSYAASGVLATTGSPLHVMVSNVGLLNQQMQQEYQDSQRKQQLLYKQAEEGVYYGQAQASADRAQGTAALLTGGAQIAGMAFKAYDSGVFSGGGGAKTAAPSLSAASISAASKTGAYA